jgi:hypothetical protein
MMALSRDSLCGGNGGVHLPFIFAVEFLLPVAKKRRVSMRLETSNGNIPSRPPAS